MDERRRAFAEKFIKELNRNDFKVSVSGIIVDKTGDSFLLDDGTGQVRIVSQQIPNYSYLRVFGKIMPVEDGFEIQSDIIQDLGAINKNVHKKVKTLLS